MISFTVSCGDPDRTAMGSSIYTFFQYTRLAQALVTRDPSLPALPLLLLFHLRLICVAYVTTVLVRHWAVLHQQMGSNQRGQQPQLNVKIARASMCEIDYNEDSTHWITMHRKYITGSADVCE